MNTGSYINGQWVEGQSSRMVRNVNPADTNDVIAEFPMATAEQTQQAIEAAQAAFPAWKRTPGPERGRVIWRAVEIARRRHARRHAHHRGLGLVARCRHLHGVG